MAGYLDKKATCKHQADSGIREEKFSNKKKLSGNSVKLSADLRKSRDTTCVKQVCPESEKHDSGKLCNKLGKPSNDLQKSKNATGAKKICVNSDVDGAGKLCDNSVKPSDGLQNGKNVFGSVVVCPKSDKGDSGKGTARLHRGYSNTMKLSEKKVRSLYEPLQKATLAGPVKNNREAVHQTAEVIPRPGAIDGAGCAPPLSKPCEATIVENRRQNEVKHLSIEISEPKARIDSFRDVGKGSYSMAGHLDKKASRKHQADSDVHEEKFAKRKKMSDNFVKSSADLRKSRNATGVKKACTESEKLDSSSLYDKLGKLSNDLQMSKNVTGAKNICVNSDMDGSSKLCDNSVKPSDGLQNGKNVFRSVVVCPKSDKGDSGKGTAQLHREHSETMKLTEKKVRSLDEPLQKAILVDPVKNSTEAVHQTAEVTQGPDMGRRNWFKMTWERRIQMANDAGKLVLLQNFDPSFTSAEIEVIMHHFCNQTVSARVISLFPPYCNPYYGQAYVIFRTSDAADATIEKINTGCLMLNNGSAFTASKGLLELPPKPTNLVGHLRIEKFMRRRRREEMREAVSTSHCSQPNSIEYEMAMEWCLLQERAVKWFGQLHKRHDVEAAKVKKSLKA